ncbi:hypothetical protein ENSA5_26490 [Enhygromyxa salina]|uniref:Uncharacterized protein n=1 Tax=Enhygromyxa salina TaxID=215803 RepID=A0A2S9YAH1_9BACT|nr:hypothetical protein ENSA5_26490 [Enhygromyxa salina]
MFVDDIDEFGLGADAADEDVDVLLEDWVADVDHAANCVKTLAIATSGEFCCRCESGAFVGRVETCGNVGGGRRPPEFTQD